MGALKTSEQGDVAAGEGHKDPTADDRPVDSGAKIIIAPDPVPTPPRRVTPTAQRALPPLPLAPRKRGGLAIVILAYVLSASALAYAIYERFVA